MNPTDNQDLDQGQVPVPVETDLAEDDIPVSAEATAPVANEPERRSGQANENDSENEESFFDALYAKYPIEIHNTHPKEGVKGATFSNVRKIDIDTNPEQLEGVVYLPSMDRELHAEQVREQTRDGVDQLRRFITVRSAATHPRHGDLVKNDSGVFRASGAYTRSARRQTARWEQQVSHNGNEMAISKPKMGEPGDKLVGDRAFERMRSMMGFAETVRIPLWHSGVWITIRGPSDRDLIALISQMRREAGTVGRTTTGAALSNQVAMHADTLTMFLRNYIVETSYYSLEELFTIIKAQDFDTMLAGLAASIYTRGFEFVRVVGSRGENDEYETVRARLNIPKSMWTDTNMLTDRQRSHMTLRASGSMTKQSVEEYQKGFVSISPRICTYVLSTGKEVKIELTPPFLYEFINAGHAWIEELQNLVTRTLGTDADETLRNTEIAKLARATYLRMYSHWVTSIEVDGTSTTDREQGALPRLLDELSADDLVINKFPLDVGQYIDDTTVSLVATTALTEDEANSHKRFPQLVPINILATFFQLLSQKAARADQTVITSEAVL